MYSLRSLPVLLTAFVLASFAHDSAFAAPKKDFRICWTVYAGWMPWGYAKTHGIIDKWAKKYDIKIDVVKMNDYVDSINKYTAGSFDGCTMTNMDALAMPAAAGLDTTALIVGDYSNGNDGVLVKGKGKTLADLKGQPVNLVKLSVSHYLLARGLEVADLSEDDVKIIDTSDANIAAAFATPAVRSIVTWNPLLTELKAQPDVSEVFDSSKIPGEIMDMMVVNTKTLSENPALGKALTGAWFETLRIMTSGTAQGQAALSEMGNSSGTDLAGYMKQLSTTAMFYTPRASLEFVTSADLPKIMSMVAQFSFRHGLLGRNALNANVVGASYGKGGTAGSTSTVRLRFDPTYLRMAVGGKL
jgi:NitT/TauT family transport system substrate-binding protein